jgi:hypothetical protein
MKNFAKKERGWDEAERKLKTQMTLAGVLVEERPDEHIECA